MRAISILWRKLLQLVYYWGEFLLSINIFDKSNDNGEDEVLTTISSKEKKLINDFEEEIETYVVANNISPTDFQNIQVITDEVYNQTVRVKGETVHQVIKRELYQAYIKIRNKRDNGIGNLVTLCPKDNATKVVEHVEKNFGAEYTKHRFDILKIIDEATDVRNARFNVKIETVNSVSMRGTRVHDTSYYSQMLNRGDLTGVIISYDMPSQSVTFRINIDGSIFLFNQLTDYEILDLVEDLLNI